MPTNGVISEAREKQDRWLQQDPAFPRPIILASPQPYEPANLLGKRVLIQLPSSPYLGFKPDFYTPAHLSVTCVFPFTDRNFSHQSYMTQLPSHEH